MTLVDVGGRELKLSNLDKVLYPEVGFTKGQVIGYYQAIAGVLLPHLDGRPLTLKRYPNGVDAGHFYEKRCPSHRPEWVSTVLVHSERNKGEIPFCVVDDLATLVWVANLASLELHTSLSRGDRITRPTMIVFDLDPGPPANVVQCAEVALALRDVLDHLGLQTVVKTSGNKGMQMYVPLNDPKASYDGRTGTKEFAHALAQILERQMADLVVSSMSKEMRPGKVFIDWSQNDEHKTTVSVYSLRAREQPTVSTPISWGEVEALDRERDATAVTFVADEVVERVAAHGDLFAPALTLEQSVPAL